MSFFAFIFKFAYLKNNNKFFEFVRESIGFRNASFFKETNLKDIQSRSRLRLFAIDSLYGSEDDRNTTFEILRYGY